MYGVQRKISGKWRHDPQTFTTEAEASEWAREPEWQWTTSRVVRVSYWAQFYRNMFEAEHIAYLRSRFGSRWWLAWLQGCTVGALALWHRRREIRRDGKYE